MTLNRIHSTRFSPFISFNTSCGSIDVRGRSVMNENEKLLFPLQSIVCSDEFQKNNFHSLNVYLDYVSSKTLQCLFQFAVSCYQENNTDFEINWYYNAIDQEVKETLEDMREVLPFSLNVIPEEY